ncbi:MAG: hypothetical protein ACYCO9_16605 [Streptosporangiaceae bacterium]
MNTDDAGSGPGDSAGDPPAGGTGPGGGAPAAGGESAADGAGPERPERPERPVAGQAYPADNVPTSELAHLIDDAVIRIAAVGRARIHRQAHAEPRWPASASVVVAIVLQLLLPRQLALLPGFLLPLLEAALLIGLTIANPVRIERGSGPIRAASVAMIVLLTLANAISAALLIRAIAENRLPVGATHAAIGLLSSGALIWGTNVIAFALWYWEFDRGGPVRRLEHTSAYPDLMFPQMTAPALTPPGWGPRFVDYLYLSFTNATAFSPTDVMPLARWAKLTMLAQSTVSLAVGALVIARAVNII